MFPILYEYWRKSSIDPFSPVIWVSFGMFFTFGAEAAMRTVHNDYTFSAEVVPQITLLHMRWTLLWACISLLLFLIGYYWSKLDSVTTKIPKISDNWSSERASKAAVIFLIIGIIGYIYLLPQIGTGNRSQLTRGSNMIGFMAVNMLNVSSIIILANIFISYITIDSDSNIKFKKGYIVNIVVGILIIAFNTNILLTLGGRRNGLHILIAGIFLFHYILKRINVYSGIGLYLCINVFREWLSSIVIPLIQLDFENVTTAVLSPTLFTTSQRTGFNNLTIIFAGASEHTEYWFGSTFISPFFILLRPFSLQIGTESDVAFNSIFNPSAVGSFGYPMTLIGELYLNFWYIGIIVGFLLLGMITRMIYKETILEQSTGSVVLFCMLTNSFPVFANFSNSVPAIGLRLLPLLLAIIYISGGIKKH